MTNKMMIRIVVESMGISSCSFVEPLFPVRILPLTGRFTSSTSPSTWPRIRPSHPLAQAHAFSGYLHGNPARPLAVSASVRNARCCLSYFRIGVCPMGEGKPPAGKRATVRVSRRLQPVGAVAEHGFDVVAGAVDEGAAGVEHRERPAEVEARYARFSDRRDTGIPLLADVDRAALDGDPAGAIPRGAHDRVERLPCPGGECRRPVRQVDDRVRLAQGEDPEAEQLLQDAIR